MHGSTTLTIETDEHWLADVRPGMDVRDGRGERIGVVAQVYRHSEAVTEAWFVAEWQACPLPSEMVEVEAESLEPGLRLYLPVRAIRNVTEASLFLHEQREALKRAGYHGGHAKPVCIHSGCPLFEQVS